MNSQRTAVLTMAELSDIGLRARRRIAYRLLPFVFLIYIVNYIDRVNVSFANLRMSADLGFSDRVYGLGVGMFYLTYVLFEIPGAVIVERWSARKWIARIMISWGIVTALTGLVHTAGQFYVARFLLGVAESSFFPAMIVYLTHWFRMRERSRAIACLYAAVPAGSLIGSPLAGWLLGVHWQSMAGWRWLFILEGIPAIVLGIITIFYLTDWPAQARWLPEEERDWLVNELQAEQEAKKKKCEPFDDRSVLRPTNSNLGICLLSGPDGISRKRLLDTNFCEAPFGVFQPNRDIAAADSSVDGGSGDAHQRLALRYNRRAALAHSDSSAGRRLHVRPLKLFATRCHLSDCFPTVGERVPVRILSNFLGDTYSNPK